MERKMHSAKTVDELGRIIIPLTLRGKFRIGDGDKMDIFEDVDEIILKKSIIRCVACDGTEDMKRHNERDFCDACHAKLSVS